MRYAALIGLFALLACEKQWTTPVLDVDCGSMKLRFEEHGRDHGWPSGATAFTPVLMMNDRGAGWVPVDTGGRHSNPTSYARLLPASMKFHLFDPTITIEDEQWVVFADPAKITDAQYAAVGRCIDEHLAAIDAAWNKPRPPADSFDYGRDRKPHLAAMLHVPDDTNLSTRWTCADGTFVRTSPPDWLERCAGDRCSALGRIENDGTVAALYASVDPEPLRACRDASGRGLWETLQPVKR